MPNFGSIFHFNKSVSFGLHFNQLFFALKLFCWLNILASFFSKALLKLVKKTQNNVFFIKLKALCKNSDSSKQIKKINLKLDKRWLLSQPFNDKPEHRIAYIHQLLDGSV